MPQDCGALQELAGCSMGIVTAVQVQTVASLVPTQVKLHIFAGCDQPFWVFFEVIPQQCPLCNVLELTCLSQLNLFQQPWCRYDAALEKAKYNALALQQAAAAREDEVVGRPYVPIYAAASSGFSAPNNTACIASVHLAIAALLVG